MHLPSIRQVNYSSPLHNQQPRQMTLCSYFKNLTPVFVLVSLLSSSYSSPDDHNDCCLSNISTQLIDKCTTSVQMYISSDNRTCFVIAKILIWFIANAHCLRYRHCDCFSLFSWSSSSAASTCSIGIPTIIKVPIHYSCLDSLALTGTTHTNTLIWLSFLCSLCIARFSRYNDYQCALIFCGCPFHSWSFWIMNTNHILFEYHTVCQYVKIKN